jgi:hypothetical protein
MHFIMEKRKRLTLFPCHRYPLAVQAQEVFNKNLKPIAPPNAAYTNAQIEKDLDQLKAAIDNKAPLRIL